MTVATVTIETAPAFLPLLSPARYKAAHGGRGSGKSWFFASLMVEEHLANPGQRSVCIREVQKSLKESAKRLLESKIEEFGLGEKDGFRCLSDRIDTPGNGTIIFQGMQDHTAESIKSLEGFNRAWVEEAQTLSSRSLQLLRPTIRAPGSELWFSWNPRMRTDPVDAMFRGGEPPTNSIVVEANYSENPWLPNELEQERLDCLRDNPDQYEHIWGGGYVTVAEGAYFARPLALARSEGRIGVVPSDPMMRIRTFWDIGGTGAKADACAIWVAQFIGQQINVVDYYEAQGQPLSAHVAWMRESGYDGCEVVLPHDGATNDRVHQVSYESALREAGFPVTVVPNQGAGAANMRIEAVRRMFPRMWFDERKCEGGLAALGWYHEKKDENRNIGLGPEHDWSSHGCFHGATEVLTRYGMRRIDSLEPTGEILTPCGWKQYILPRITKRAAPLVEVAFSDGHSVRCTPDHLFLTESGWKSAASLRPNTAIRSTLTRSRSISMVVFTACGQARSICRAAANAFIATFGNLPSAPFRLDAISTTGTATCLTTSLKTWSASPPLNICRNRGPSEPSPGTVGSPQRRATRPLTGIALPRAGFGIVATPSARKAGQNGSVFQSIARSVVLNFKRWSERAGIRRFIARALARPLLIESVTPLNERADVWDITVPDGHWFSLANGAVVHNSDAFGLLAISYRPPTNITRKITYPTKGIV